MILKLSKMKIALAQLNSNNNIDHNFNMISELVRSAIAEKPDIIFFPENSLFFRLSSAAKVQALRIDGEIFQKLARLASETSIALHLTTAIEDNLKIFNASVLIRPGENPEILYRKIHLFDIALKDQAPIRESDSFQNGEVPQTFELNGFKFGSSICYDIRFAELYQMYAGQQVDAILVPAAFLVKTGQAHWEVLLRARAIESQCYVIAAAQAGRHVGENPDEVRETYGHSMAIDPWGKVIEQRQSDVGLLYVKLNKKDIESVREQIPMKNHRRL